MRLICLLLSIVLAGLIALAAVDHLNRKKPESAKDDYDPVRMLWVPPEPVTRVQRLPVSAARDALAPEDLVLGVTIGNESRAYPICDLTQAPAYKIVNDDLGGHAIAASYCDYCHTGIVFDRDLDGRTLTFGVFGELWRGSMIMYDQETKTHWSHLQGEAKRGPLAGTKLHIVPSLVTDWSTWRSKYPESTVAMIDKSLPRYQRAIYDNARQFVLGIAEDGQAAAWPLDLLEAQPCRNEQIDGRAILVVMDRSSRTARTFQRQIRGTELTFRYADGQLQDAQTGTTWDAVTGRALSGPLAGEQLRPLPALISDREVWLKFFPNSIRD